MRSLKFMTSVTLSAYCGRHEEWPWITSCRGVIAHWEVDKILRFNTDTYSLLTKSLSHSSRAKLSVHLVTPLVYCWHWLGGPSVSISSGHLSKSAALGTQKHLKISVSVMENCYLQICNVSKTLLHKKEAEHKVSAEMLTFQQQVLQPKEEKHYLLLLKGTKTSSFGCIKANCVQ